ncbi:MAG: hypothetical protein ACRCUY_01730 [Thermoguttaceae bacterium]
MNADGVRPQQNPPTYVGGSQNNRRTNAGAHAPARKAVLSHRMTPDFSSRCLRREKDYNETMLWRKILPVVFLGPVAGSLVEFSDLKQLRHTK